MTRVILIRHGETADTRVERYSERRSTPLTEEGQAQARCAADHLASGYQLDALYASPLVRTLETARIIGERFGCQPSCDARLQETDYGRAEGLTRAEIEMQMPEVVRAALDRGNMQFRWPGGETRAEFRARVRKAFEEIVAAHDGQTVAIVSHGPVISVILQSIAGDDGWRVLEPGLVAVVEITSSGRSFHLLEGSRFMDWLSGR